MLSFFRNLKILWKLIIAFVCIALGSLVVGFLGVKGMKAEERILADIFAQNVLPLETSNKLSLEISRIRLLEFAHISSEDPEQSEKIAKEISARDDSFAVLLKELSAQALDDKQNSLAGGLENQMKSYKEIREKVIKDSNEFMKEEAKSKANGEGGKAFDALFGSVSELSQYTAKLAQTRFALAKESQKSMLVQMMVSMAVGAVIALLLGIVIARGISAPLARGLAFVREVAEGDFSKRLELDRQDEVGELVGAMNQMCMSVSEMVGSSANASQEIARATSSQAAAIEETSSSVEEMNSMTRQNLDNAKQADGLIRENSSLVSQATASMSELIASMNEISEASSQTAKIIKTIDEIAFQTNLLALNAAVEAARAGEAGAGFAVVANEVRSLAMRAAEAARNTASLIEDTVKKIENGAGIVERTNRNFSGVEEGSRKIALLVNEIVTAMGEQSRGVEQIARAVADIDQAVQSNVATAEELASAMSMFKVDEGQGGQGLDQPLKIAMR